MYRNATFALRDGLSQIQQNGHTVEVRGQEIKELRPFLMGIQEPLERVYVWLHRNNNIFAAIAETMWILAGRNDLEFITHYLKRAPEFSDDGVVWRGGYGPRLRNWSGVDQIEKVIELLTEEAQSRRAVMSLFDPQQDFVNSKDIPCNNWLHFIVREDKLHLHVAIRSNDAIWGFSGINTFEWSVLHEMMAYWIGKPVGDVTYFVSSFHLYERHYEKAELMLRNFPRVNPYDSGYLAPRFSTAFAEFDTGLNRWFEIEQRIRNGESVATDVESISDEFFRVTLQMMQIHQDLREGTEITSVFRGIEALPDCDFKIAVIEYVGRNLQHRAALKLRVKDASFFDEFWSDTPKGATPQPTEALGFDDIHQVLSAMHAAKTRVYKDSWKRHGEVIGAFANIARKHDRLETLMVDHVEPSIDETAFDTAADLAVYAIKYLTLLAEKYPDMFLAFAHQYLTHAEDLPFKENLEGFNAVIAALRKRYQRNTPKWLAILDTKSCFREIQYNYSSLEKLLLTVVADSADAQKPELGANLAIASIHLLIVMARESPSGYADFAQKHIEEIRCQNHS